MHMGYDHLAAVDLNLLAPLAALLDERHVSRAANRVGLSQPAMSRALRRLRAALDDELLVRSSTGYRLTPKGERIHSQLIAILPELDTLFRAEPFNPSVAAEHFRIVGSDFAAVLLGPPLFQELFRQSPESTMHFLSWHESALEDLERGSVDLVFYAVAPPAGLRSELLFEERFVCALSETHPLAQNERMSLEEYLSCSHVVIEVLDGQTVIERRLETLRTPRRATLRVPYHTAAELTVPGTTLVATLPERFVRQHPIDPTLRIIAAPEEIETMSYSMAWHPRLDNDPAQRWLRDTIRAVASEL
jgi:DNA-binding transcriptional LysR family regulator